MIIYVSVPDVQSTTTHLAISPCIYSHTGHRGSPKPSAHCTTGLATGNDDYDDDDNNFNRHYTTNQRKLVTVLMRVKLRRRYRRMSMYTSCRLHTS